MFMYMYTCMNIDSEPFLIKESTETERPMGFISSAQCLEKEHHYTDV